MKKEMNITSFECMVEAYEKNKVKGDYLKAFSLSDKPPSKLYFNTHDNRTNSPTSPSTKDPRLSKSKKTPSQTSKHSISSH